MTLRTLGTLGTGGPGDSRDTEDTGDNGDTGNNGHSGDDGDIRDSGDWGHWGHRCRPQVFDSAGSFLSYINTGADPLYGPQGLALAPDGHVLVADSGNHCFKAYRYLQ